MWLQKGREPQGRQKKSCYKQGGEQVPSASPGGSHASSYSASHFSYKGFNFFRCLLNIFQKHIEHLSEHMFNICKNVH